MKNPDKHSNYAYFTSSDSTSFYVLPKILDQECQGCLKNTEREITVLENVPTADHIYLNKNPDHQTQSKYCSNISCRWMPSQAEDASDELTDTIHKKENDPGNEKITKWRTLQHIRRKQQMFSRRKRDHECTADRGSNANEYLDNSLNSIYGGFHYELFSLKKIPMVS
jgi:hypothetical protein